MSDADVALVRALQPGPDVDLAFLFTDPVAWSEFAENAAAFFADDFECAAVGAPQGKLEGKGFEGLRDLFAEWLGPWSSYKSTVEDVSGTGEKVMVLVRDRGVSKHDGVEVELLAASVWTMRDGRVTHVEFHTSRDSARAAL
jgi:ketosteroid isomerase-like protein